MIYHLIYIFRGVGVFVKTPSPPPSPKTFEKIFWLARAKTKTAKQNRTLFRGGAFLGKRLPRTPFKNFSENFLAGARPKQRQQDRNIPHRPTTRSHGRGGACSSRRSHRGGLFEKSPSPDASPKTFRPFSVAARGILPKGAPILKTKTDPPGVGPFCSVVTLPGGIQSLGACRSSKT